tara:strand:- start:204 stop:581 length:378 start_codon:yes stop_codon:yes gene_type:complete
MSKNTINVSFWKQSTGRTGQCLTERGQKLYDVASVLYKQVTGKKLSKERVYDLVLEVSRGARKQEGFYIQNTSSSAFMLAMQDLTSFCRAELKGKPYKAITFGEFKVDTLTNLATAKVGRKGKVA